MDSRAGKVEAELEALTGTVTDAVGAAVESLTSAAERVFDPEDGDAAAVMARFRTETEDLLGRSFDPESKTSIASRLEVLLATAVDELLAGHQDSFARALDPDMEGSPMSRLVKQVSGIAAQMAQFSEAVAVRKATVAALERSAVKGQAYEELVRARRVPASEPE